MAEDASNTAPKYCNIRPFFVLLTIFFQILFFSSAAMSATNWTGLGPTNNWTDPLNWTSNSTPDATSIVTFDATSTKVCTIDAAALAKKLYISSGYTGTIIQNANLTISLTFTQEAGTFTCADPDSYAFTCESFSIPGGTFNRYTIDGSTRLLHDVYALQAMNQSLSSAYKLHDDINAGFTGNWDTNDDGAKEGFLPVGDNTNKFTGSFNGNNKTITGLYINRTSTNFIGLFGYTYGATISNIGLINNQINGGNEVGGLVGEIYFLSAISNSYATGNISGVTCVGGLVGENFYSTITNSYATGTTSGTGTDIGGLVGGNSDYSTITNSYATGATSGNSDIGGLVGYNYFSSTITNSYATGATSGNSDIGGLVGFNSASSTTTNSYATGNASGTGTNIGGLVGYKSSSSTITNSYYCGSPDNSLGTQVTTVQLMQKGTFSNWDFTNTWLMDENKNYPYHTYEAWNLAVGGTWTTGTDWNKNLIVQADYPQTNNDQVFIGTGVSGAVPSGATLGGLHLGTGAGTVTLAGNLTLDNAGTREGSLSVYGGTLNAGSGTIKIDGNFAKGTGGTLTQGTSTVSFESTSPSSIEGSTTFHNFTCTIANKSLTFEAGGVTTIESGATLTLTGTSGNLIILRSSSSPTQWKIDLQGTNSLNYLDAKDSNNINASALNPSNSVNSGNNTNWFTTTTWTGLGPTNNWTDPLNWTSNSTPDATSVVTFDATSTKVCTIDAAALAKKLYISSGYTGTITQNADLTVSLTFIQEAGTFTCAAPDSYAFTCESFSIPGGTFNRYTLDGSTRLLHDVYALQAMKQSLSSTYKLHDDINAGFTVNWDTNDDSAKEGFLPVGNSTNKFTGSFNGNNKTITGLYINRTSTSYVGLFGYINGAVISNIGLINNQINGNNDVGGLVGYNDVSSTIINCYATGNVGGAISVGGLVGKNYSSSTISNSYATGNANGTFYVGGLVGENNDSTITNSYVTGIVTGSSDFTGGLVGLNDASAIITNSYATGNVNGSSDVGGLVGFNETSSTITNCYATGIASGIDSVGGLVARNTSSTITNSYYCGSPNNGLGTQVTTAQLMQKGTFSGWDFTNTWLMDENKNYPYHTYEAWNTPPADWTTLSWKKNLVVQADYPQTNNDKVFIGTGESTTVPSGVTIGGLHLSTGAGTVTLAGNLTLDNAGTREGNLSIYGGTLNAGSSTIKIDGNFAKGTGGTLTQGTSTVSFESTSPSSIEGSTTFHNFTCTIANKPLTFEAGEVTTIESGATLTLTSTSGNLIILRSSSSPTQWKIDPQGTNSLNYLDAKDSNNINASALNPSNSVNSGNNTNWFIPAPDAPANFSAVSASTTQLNYTWTDNSTNESGFKILDDSNNVKVLVAAGATSTSESGLLANTQYTRKVQSYNNVGAATSDAASKYTSIEAAASATWEGITSSSITIHSINEPSNLGTGDSGIYFENTTAGTNSGWIKTNTWTSSGLSAGTSYTFRITARNGDAAVAATLDAGSKTTDSGTVTVNTPEADNFSSVKQTKITANWKANGNPATFEYYCENTTAGTNSGWIKTLSWECSDLSTLTEYAFRVKARESSTNESDWRDLGVTTTEAYATADAYVAGVGLENGDTISSMLTITVSLSSESTISTSGIKPLATLGGVKKVYVDSAEATYDIISSTDFSVTLKFRDALSVGMHTIKIITYDSAGTEYVLERTGLIVSSGTVTTAGPTLVYPNPYDPLAGNVKITYYLSVGTDVNIYISDKSGRMVWKNVCMSGTNGGKAGYNEVSWNTVGIFGQLTSDVYFINMVDQSTGKVITKTKLLVWKGGVK